MSLLNGNKQKLDFEQDDIWLFADSRIERESRLFSCAKEPDTVKWIVDSFKQGDVVFDIGSNVGAYTLIMSKFVGSKGSVFSFEPNWINFYELNRNIVLNKATNNVSALNWALSSSKRIDTFNYRDLEAGSSLHTFGKAVDFVGNEFIPECQQSVCSLTLDQFVNEYNVPHVNHIKIDVDGIESEIIEGGIETFSSAHCKSIMVELNEDFNHDLESIRTLERAGFSIEKKVPNPSSFVESGGLYNYFFTK
jgi:FkbM family methyltransferase